MNCRFSSEQCVSTGSATINVLQEELAPRIHLYESHECMRPSLIVDILCDLLKFFDGTKCSVSEVSPYG